MVKNIQQVCFVLHIRHRGDEKPLYAVILLVSTCLGRNTPEQACSAPKYLTWRSWFFSVTSFPP